MKNKYTYLILFLLGIFFLFFLREWMIQNKKVVQFWAKDHYFFFELRDFVLLSEEIDPDVTVFLDQRTSFRNPQKKKLISDLETSQKYFYDFWSVEKITDAYIVFEIFSEKFVFFGPEIEEDKEKILALPRSLEADFWILPRTIHPSFFPPPKKGIFFVGTRSPGKSLLQWAQEEKIPLISTQKTKGFRYFWNDSLSEWELYTSSSVF